MCGLWSKLLLGAMLGAAVLLALAIIGSRSHIAGAVRGFDLRFLLPALLLASLNYALRFARWQLYLRRTGVALPLRHSAVVFASGLGMSATPGKVGELFKAAMLRDEGAAPLPATVPVVVAERVADLAAVALLAGAGLLALPQRSPALALGGLAVLVVVGAVAASPRLLRRTAGWLTARAVSRLASGRPGQAAEALDRAGEAFAVLLRGTPLVAGLALGLLAWLAECVALWLVVMGLGWHGLTPQAAVAVYAGATLAGALSLLPGGLGVTELSMAALLSAAGAPQGVPVAATVLVRLCTLWFAVALGVTVYLGYRATRLAPAPLHDVGPPEARHGR